MGLPKDYDYKFDELNRIYVLLTYELEELYKQNPKLAAIEPKPFWTRYNILTPYSSEILRYLGEPTQERGRAHIHQLDRLCIITNSEKPELSPENLKLVEETLVAIKNYEVVLEAAESKRAELEDEFHNDDAWYIPEYAVSHNNGEIVINDVWCLKKTHIGSTIDLLLGQAFKNQNILFTPKLPSTARNISTVLSSAGFNPVMRKIFFPKATAEGVLFRPVVTFEQAQKDGIDTTTLDLILEGIAPDIKNTR